MTALVLAVVAAWLVLGRDGDRERAHDFPIGPLAAVDGRFPKSVRVVIRSPMLTRITFSSRQAPTKDEVPGVAGSSVETQISFSTVDAGLGCTYGGATLLGRVSRIWEARRGSDVAAPRTPYDVFNRAGLKIRRESHVDLSAGSSVALRLRRPLPDHVCVRVHTWIGDGTARDQASIVDRAL